MRDPASKPCDPRPPLILPRGLIVLSAVWLLISWLIAIGYNMPIQPSAATFTPGVRLMLLCVAIGLMIGWPLLRLSQQPTAWPIRQTMLDLVALLALVQIVIWPMRLITAWPPQRVAAIDATMIGWALLAGAVVAATTGARSRGPRNLGMLACVSMCVLGPALAWVGVLRGSDWMQVISLGPLMAIHTLGKGGGAPPTADQWRWITLLIIAAVAAWVVLWLVHVMRPRREDGDVNHEGPPPEVRATEGE